MILFVETFSSRQPSLLKTLIDIHEHSSLYTGPDMRNDLLLLMLPRRWICHIGASPFSDVNSRDGNHCVLV